jgi:uncharacterized protein YodC (DUF2158 family)
MDKPKFKEGDWVKEKTGTRGMTVVASSQTDGQTDSSKVRCRFKQEDGTDREENFKESDLVPLN